jgi:hypothetical protein
MVTDHYSPFGSAGLVLKGQPVLAGVEPTPESVPPLARHAYAQGAAAARRRANYTDALIFSWQQYKQARQIPDLQIITAPIELFDRYTAYFERGYHAAKEDRHAS